MAPPPGLELTTTPLGDVATTALKCAGPTRGTRRLHDSAILESASAIALSRPLAAC